MVRESYPSSKEEPWPSRPSLRCLPNIEKFEPNGEKHIKYENQIRGTGNVDFNHIYFVLGAKALPKFDREAGSSTPFNHWSKADKAIVMETVKSGNDVNLLKEYDVGLIVVPKTVPTLPKPIMIYKRYADTKSWYVDEYDFSGIAEVFKIFNSILTGQNSFIMY